MNTPIKILLAFTVLFTVSPLSAQQAEIVKQDGKTVYIDISALEQKPAKGSPFTITIEGEDIINPKTGQTLGKTPETIIKGRITNTEDLFAVGKTEKQTADLTGREVAFPKQEQKAEDIKSDTFLEDFPSGTPAPLWQTALEQPAKAVAACDIDGDGETEIILAGLNKNTLSVYNLTQDKKLEKKTSYNLAEDKTVLTADCAAVNGSPVTLFVSVFDNLRQNLVNYPFTWQDNGLKQQKGFEGIINGITPNNGQRMLFTQKLLKHDKTFVLSEPAQLNFKNNNYKAGKELKTAGLKSIFAFNFADLENTGLINTVYTTKQGKIRLQFKDKEDYIIFPKDGSISYSPNSFVLGGKTQRFYLPLASFTDNNKAVIAAITGDKKSQKASLVFFKWTGETFAKYKIFPIEGTIYDMKQTPFTVSDSSLLIIYNYDGKGFLAVYECANI